MTADQTEFTANVEMPLVVASADDVDWHDEADLVVAGFGGAGVVAALQAREDGASVIAVDRFGGGGATAVSGGVVYAGGTPYQREAGFDDSAEEMFKYLSFEGTPVRDDTLRRFCENSGENIDWLTGYGVKFGSSFYGERIAYPPDGYFLYFTGMEKFRGQEAYPAPRGHRTVGKGPTGKHYFAPLKDAALKQGVKLMTHAPVRRLVLDEHSRVVGIDVQAIPEAHQAEHQALFKKVDPYKMLNGATAEDAVAECREFEARVPQKRLLIRARRGVVLAAGGYNYNLELFGRYRPRVTAAYKQLVRGGSMGCDGSGIELGVSAGGAIDCMERVFVSKAISPPNAFVKGVLVNLEGKRFINEDAYLGNVGEAVSEQSGSGTAWLILDSATFWQGFKQAVWPIKNIFSWWGLPAILNIFLGGTKRARTLSGLARKCSIDGHTLERTITEHNTAAKDRRDPVFGKMTDNIAAMDRAPFFAINLSLKNKWGFSGTMPYGGLTVDEDTGAVTRADGSLIQGLYAAGRTAVGVCSKSNFSGLSIADTVFSGRRAARAALLRNQPTGTQERLAG